MTLSLKLPGAVSSAASLATQTDFIADLANDSRVLGIWRLNSDYATLSGSDVTSFANLKTGGLALTSTSYRGQLATDNVIGRSVLSCDNADPVQYECALDMSSYTASGMTFFLAGRFLNDGSRLAYTDGTYLMDFRTTLSGSSTPQLRGYLGTSEFAQVSRLGDPRRLTFATLAFDASADILLQANGDADATKTTTNPLSTTTKFYLGSQNVSLAPTANFDMVAVFLVDINAAANADLLALWNKFQTFIYA